MTLTRGGKWLFEFPSGRATLHAGVRHRVAAAVTGQVRIMITQGYAHTFVIVAHHIIPSIAARSMAAEPVMPITSGKCRVSCCASLCLPLVLEAP